MYTKIVVGTDGSGTAGIALRRAIELGAAMGAEVHVVHAHQLLNISASVVDAQAGSMSVNISAVNTGIRDDSDSICGVALRAAKDAGVRAEGHSVPGDPADALLAVAQSVGADVIVLGNRGMTGKRRFVLGSVPNKVSHHCPCDVLIVNTERG